MSPNSPESPSKKRKQPINGLKRDQPLFAGRRPHRSLQQPPEFLTDSLNTSYIPSPSPPKSPTRQNVRAKPRQALGNGLPLKAAFKATPRINDENKPPSSASSSDRKRTQETLKPRPAQSTTRAKALSPSKLAESPTRTTTPSPSRGRQTSIISPSNSESSPGRGYAEAYQRIGEEENLAQEDSIEDMEEMDGYDFNQQDRSQSIDRLRLQRLQQSAPPMSLKASRKASPRGVIEDSPTDNKADEKENVGHESDSESALDYTENITDTSIDSGSSQYAKDLQRLGALKSGTKVFSKARVGERVGLSVENLHRRNGSNESLGSAFSSGSFSNRGSDPSINVPKAWGRKAKPSKDWLSRINNRSGKFTGDTPKRHSSGDQIIAENQSREWSEPIDQWIATAAEVPLPSSEDRSSQLGASSRGSLTPTTAVPRTSSLDRRRQWEINDDDFTGRSLQISESPPIRIRNAILDRIRDREIESLEKRGVTTSRLGELREKSSGDNLQRIPSHQSVEEPQQEEQGAPQDVNKRKPSSKEIPQSEASKPVGNETPEDSMHDEGEPIPDTPVVIYRSNSNSQPNMDQKSSDKAESKRQISRRPSHERKDSHDLLKRLARVTSESPSPPTRDHAELARPPSQADTEEQVEQTPQISRSIDNLKTPVITGGWVDQTMEQTPRPSMPNVSLKTPLVTGHWVDTPLPTGGRGPPMPTPSDPEEQKELSAGKLGAADLIHRLSPNTITQRPKLSNQAPLKYSGPPLSKSALEEIINEARSTKRGKRREAPGDSDSEEDPTLHLGESTIQSLEELIANDEDFSTLLAPTSPSQETSDPSTDPSPSSLALTTTSTTTSTTQSPGLADLQSYTHILSRLTNLAPSLRASKRQIEALDRAVSTVPQSPPALDNKDECNEAGPIHDFLFPCPHCSCPGPLLDPSSLHSYLRIRDSITTLTIPIPRLWTWKTTDRRPHLTWLGVFTCLAYILYLGESYARFHYCHPLYAHTMVGYGVDRDAPRPPFVLLKVLYRHTAMGTVLAPAYHISRVLIKLVMSLVGWLVGFVFGGDGGGYGGGAGSGRAIPGQGQGQKGFRQPVSMDARIPRPAWGPDLSLMDDEYL